MNNLRIEIEKSGSNSLEAHLIKVSKFRKSYVSTYLDSVCTDQDDLPYLLKCVAGWIETTKGLTTEENI